MKYDYKDIIIDPSDERLEIGAEYYASDGIQTLLTIASSNRFLTKKLIRIENTLGGNFTLKDDNENEYVYWLLIRKKEEDKPSYKVGDFVKLIEGGMISYVYRVETGRLSCFDSENLGFYDFDLNGIEKVSAHAEPYDLSDPKTRRRLGGVWIKCKNGDEEFAISGFSYMLGEWFAVGETAKKLLEDYTFLNGAPVGKYVLDEEEE